MTPDQLQTVIEEFAVAVAYMPDGPSKQRASAALDLLRAERASGVFVVTESVVPNSGMVQSPARCVRCGVNYYNPTTGMVPKRCAANGCGGEVKTV